MTQRFIRSMLRRATQQKLLTGWQGPHGLAYSYTVAPANADAGEWELDRVVLYVAALEEAGVLPLYRWSEPVGAYE